MIAATWLACLFLGGLSGVPADLLQAIANDRGSGHAPEPGVGIGRVDPGRESGAKEALSGVASCRVPESEATMHF